MPPLQLRVVILSLKASLTIVGETERWRHTDLHGYVAFKAHSGVRAVCKCHTSGQEVTYTHTTHSLLHIQNTNTHRNTQTNDLCNLLVPSLITAHPFVCLEVTVLFTSYTDFQVGTGYYHGLLIYRL